MRLKFNANIALCLWKQFQQKKGEETIERETKIDTFLFILFFTEVTYFIFENVNRISQHKRNCPHKDLTVMRTYMLEEGLIKQ